MTKKKPAKKIPVEKKISEPSNPSFEGKLDQAAVAAAGGGAAGVNGGPGSEEVKPDGRGGAREGAGRPKGTDALSLVNRLPEKANETLIPILQMPFEFWAISTKTPELALSKDDAKQLALPVTQLIEFYFPGRVPEIAWVWLCMLGSVFSVLKPRIELLSRKKKLASVQGDSGPTVASTPPAASASNTDYPKIK